MNQQKIAVLAGLLACGMLLNGCSGSPAKAETAAAAPAQTEASASAPAQSETPAAPDANTSATAGASDVDGAKIIEDIATIQAFTDEAVPEEDIEAIVNAGLNAPSAMNGQPWHFSVVTDKSVLEQIAGDMGGGMPSGGMTPPSGMSLPEGMQAPEGFTPPGGGSAPDGATPPAGFTPPGGGEKPSGSEKPEGAPGGMPAAPTASGAKAGIADAPLVIIVSCKDGSDLDAGLAIQNMSAEAQLLGYGTKLISSPKMALNGGKQAEYKELLGIPEDMSAVCMLLVGKTDTAAYDAVSGATARNDAGVTVSYIG